MICTYARFHGAGGMVLCCIGWRYVEFNVGGVEEG
jgi:hypothetical protein